MICCQGASGLTGYGTNHRHGDRAAWPMTWGELSFCFVLVEFFLIYFSLLKWSVFFNLRLSQNIALLLFPRDLSKLTYMFHVRKHHNISLVRPTVEARCWLTSSLSLLQNEFRCQGRPTPKIFLGLPGSWKLVTYCFEHRSKRGIEHHWRRNCETISASSDWAGIC